MKESISIRRIESDAKSVYIDLYKLGISFLQDLSGDIWTDFNEHDPGVTILEQLCFVLAELSHRAEIPIESLLIQSNGHSAMRENALFNKFEVLGNAPVTINDYRKLLIDRFSVIHNVWIEPLSKIMVDDTSYDLTGLYNITIDLIDPAVNNSIELSQQDFNFLDFLQHKSNFSEKFISIQILTGAPISFHLELQINKNAQIEETVATILFNLTKFMKPGVNQYTIESLLEMGFTTDEILEGPRLYNGFIIDADLKDRKTKFYTEEIISIICQQALVDSVQNFYFQMNNGVDQHEIDIPKVNSFVLDINETLKQLKVYKDKILCKVNTYTVKSLYQKMLARSLKHISTAKTQNNIIPPISGKFVSAGLYNSIQRDFPSLYALGDSHLPENISQTRQSQILQLKSYLLFFEQILADSMMQIESIPKLFSIEPQKQTYFFQPLYDVPNVFQLLNGFGYLQKVTKVNFHKAIKQFESDKENEYVNKLSEIHKFNDEWPARREMFLNHLLSRFGYSISNTAIDSSKLGNEADENLSAINKITLLESLLSLVKTLPNMRSCSDKPSKEYFPKSNGIQGLLHKLLGFGYGIIDLPKNSNFQYVIVTKHDQHACFRTDSKVGKIYLNTAHIHSFEAICDCCNISNYEFVLGKDEITIKVIGKKWVLTHATSKNSREIIDTCINEFWQLYLLRENIYFVDHIELFPFNVIESDTSGKIKNSLANVSPQKELLEFIKSNFNKDVEIPAFFCSRISIIILKKSARTTTNNNNVLQKILNEYLPAHLSIDIIYLDLSEREEFDEAYSKYIKCKPDGTIQMLKLLIDSGT